MSSVRVRESPFREGTSEWDRRLDDMLDDLENSTNANNNTTTATAIALQQNKNIQSSSNSSSASAAFTSAKKTLQSTSSSVIQRSASSADTRAAAATQQKSLSPAPGNSGYGKILQKSPSTSSLLGENTDSLLKEMDSALKASSNYIESHSSSQSAMPGGGTRSEYHHEYRSYSSNGGGGGGGGEFNLEKQVQHMMPPPSPSLSGLIQRSNNARNISSSQHQQQQSSSSQSYSSYSKVQSNQYSSSGDRVQSVTNEPTPAADDRPGSRLKQNIDELDTLLSDLNNAKGGGGGNDYTSDDYSFSTAGQRTYNTSTHEYHSSQVQSSTAGKPPSPSPRRRPSDGQRGDPRSLSSPATVRKVSPGPVSRGGGRGASPPSGGGGYSSYHHESSSSQQQQQKSTVTSMQEYTSRASPPKSTPISSNGTPQGTSYYQKYHSSYQQQQQSYSPGRFPSNGNGGNGPTQAPPTRVDDLMTELSEFDPSIQPTGFVEPPPKTETDYARQYRDRSASPPRKPHQGSPTRSRSSPPPASKSGPAVYYPPGEMFSSTKAKYTDNMDSSGQNGTRSGQVETSAVMEEGGGGRGRAEYKAKYGYKEKSKHTESDGKQGAAVIPICLPLCCAAPCTIL